MIVIDVGCAKYGGDRSIEHLVRELEPSLLLGFDPGSEYPPMFEEGSTLVCTFPLAVWTHTGTVSFRKATLGGRVDSAGEETRCIDIVPLVRACVSAGETALKLDAEGAEYELLPRLIDEGLDDRLKLLWIEWHDKAVSGVSQKERLRRIKLRDMLEAALACEVAEWRY